MKKTNPNFEIKKTSNTLKADRAIHGVTFNPNRASPAEVLRVPVPKHKNRDVLVPGFFHSSLTQQLVVTQTIIS